MAQGQVSVGIRGKMAEVLAEAYEVFPAAKSDSQAFSMFILEMYRIYQENGKTKIETDIAEMKATLRRLVDMMEPGK